MKNKIRARLSVLREMRTFLVLWSTQTLSALGSAMTSYALVLWSYHQQGSALMTALLMVSSYAPYVLFSIFAGALSDRWDKRKTMLVCDALAALTTVGTLVLYKTGALAIWHLYLLNAVNGLMNTVQQPASEVATTALLPKKHYQRVGALRYFASSVTGILNPIFATAVMALAGLDAVILIDLATFGAAFVTLLCFIRIPEMAGKAREPLMQAVRAGMAFLKEKRGVLSLVLFLAAINLVSSMFSATLPAMLLPREGGEVALGVVNTVTGVTTLLGSILAATWPAPKSRVRVVCLTLLFSMSTENFILAFGRTLPLWCTGAFLGWIFIPLMSTNLDAVMRLNIPEGMQGRVYATRNSLQFFTIPVGYFLGGWLVDAVFEPLLATSPVPLLTQLFGVGKGSGAKMCFALYAALGVAVCLAFLRNRHLRAMMAEELQN